MRTLIVILNYRTPELTKRAIVATVRALAHVRDGSVVVVDNDSKDGSFESLSRFVEDRGLQELVEVVASDYNGGFGYGNNFAIRRSAAKGERPAYVHLLNSDAFPEEHAIAALVNFMDAHPEVGISGSFTTDVEGQPQNTAFRFPSLWSELDDALQFGVVTRLLHRYVVPLPIPETDSETDWVGGASMIMRREMLDEVGLFDETFFLYYEETDLCRRARLAGWPIYFVRESHVTHIGSASTGIAELGRRRPGYWFDSRRHYFVKNHGRAYFVGANAIQVAGGALFRLRRALQGQAKSRPLPERFLRDLVAHMARPDRQRVEARGAA